MAGLFHRLRREKVDSIILGDVVRIVDRSGLQDAEISGHKYLLHTSKLYQHLFIQGIPGSGKTEFLKSLIRQLVAKGVRVCVVDGAGNPNFARDICVIAREAGLPPTPVLKYGWINDSPSSVFHGFTGDNHSVFNRLVALFDLEMTGKEGDYYRNIRRGFLNHVCGVNINLRYPNVTPFEPPRSFQELANRLTWSWMNNTFGERQAASILKDREDYFAEFREMIWDKAAPLLDILHEDGFRLGEHPLTVFSINALKGGDTGKYFVQFLAQAFIDHMGRDEGTVWVIDEIGMFGGEVVKDFTKMGRQYRLGIVMALQSTASLGYKWHIEEILDSTNIKLIMRCDDAEELRRRAGTKRVTEVRHTFDETGRGRGGSEGKREVDKITLEEVKRLLPGEMFVENGNSVYKIKSPLVKVKQAFEESMEFQNRHVLRNDTPRHRFRDHTESDLS